VLLEVGKVLLPEAPGQPDMKTDVRSVVEGAEVLRQAQEQDLPSKN